MSNTGFEAPPVGCRKSIRTQRRSSETGYDQPPSMLLFALYACLRLLIDIALAPLRDRAAEQAELMVLRHQVRVLERHVKVVRWRQVDRLVCRQETADANPTGAWRREVGQRARVADRASRPPLRRLPSAPRCQCR